MAIKWDTTQNKSISWDGTSTAPPTDNRDWLQKASDFVTGNNLPGAQLGQAVGTSLQGISATVSNLGKGDLAGAAKTASKGAQEVNTQFGRSAGDVVRSAVLPASLAVGAPASVGGAAAQYAGFGAAQAAGDAAAGGAGLGDTFKEGLKGGAIGGVTGGVFNLLGKVASYGAKKVGPTAASVTSGVPKAAIEQASVNPQAVKEGIKMNVQEVRSKATASLQTLFNELNTEHKVASEALSDIASPKANAVAFSLINKVQDITKQFKVGITPTAKGMAGEFSKSSIIKGGEETAVNKALQTISTWDDFSPKGLQALNQRVNALKDFNESGVTQSSAIVGKLHDAIGEVIEKHSPELAQINANYSTNRKVLDEIGNVIGSDARDPTEIQSAVSRLDGIFKENREEYVNIIRELGKRSGVDYLSLLAGGEFQKLLPGYIRSAVAVGSVGGVGAVATNPMSLLLLPLFSPRAVGFAARNAPAAAKSTSQLSRAAATQAIPKIKQAMAGPQEK